jgi:hypothetical protein
VIPNYGAADRHAEAITGLDASGIALSCEARSELITDGAALIIL